MKLSLHTTPEGWPSRAVYLRADFRRRSFCAGFWFRLGSTTWLYHGSRANCPHWGKGWHSFRFWRVSVEHMPTERQG